MSAKKEKNVKEKKKISLTSMIFIALIAGAITGMVLHYLVPDSSVKNDVIVEGVLYVLGQGFIRLMKMLVVPLVFCSLVCGSMAIGDTKKLGNVGGKTLAFYLVTTAVAVAVALGIGTLLRPGIGLDMSKIQVNASDIETMESTSLVQTILNIIPDNPIKSLASGEMLQIIVFALIIGVILAKLGKNTIDFMGNPNYFPHLYAWTKVWSHLGFNAIIFIAGLTSVSEDLHEAAIVDGADKMQRIWNIDIPSIMPMMIILMIMEAGNLLNVGFEKAFLMQTASNLGVSEIISTYTYKMGLLSTQYSYASAIGLFNNVINCIVLVIVNKVAQKTTESSLW